MYKLNIGKGYRFLVVIFCLFTVNPLFSQETSLSAKGTLKAMFDSVYSVKQIKFEMFSQERVGGEFKKSHAKGAINFEPRKIFIRGFDEDGSLASEVLFIKGTNSNNALISPNGFPFININLDPVGETMRKDRHFTILEAGGRHLVDMLKKGMVLYESMGNESSRFEIENISSTEIKVSINNADYKIIQYQVKENETTRKVAFDNGVPEYKIVELNQDVSGYGSLEKGNFIQIPNLYAKKVEIILRAKDLIPMQVRIFDDKGLYSEYVYSVFDTHPNLGSETFNKENPAYTF